MRSARVYIVPAVAIAVVLTVGITYLAIASPWDGTSSQNLVENAENRDTATAYACPYYDDFAGISGREARAQDTDDDGFSDYAELFTCSNQKDSESTPELVEYHDSCDDDEDNDLDGSADGEDDGCRDSDGDSLPDLLDNCPGYAAGAPLYDQDGDGLAQECDDDDDGDRVLDDPDICFETLPGATVDSSGCSDAEVDPDGDGVCDRPFSAGPSNCVGLDNCPDEPNPSQADGDTDDFGDACDNCPQLSNVQDDADLDGMGDECDNDEDGDGRDNSADNCFTLPNPLQEDSDNDDWGDDCDNCPTVSNAAQDNSGDRDQHGDACDVCPAEYDPAQVNTDTDGLGDMCDNCPQTDNQDQANTDGDGVGNACDNCPADKNTAQSDTDNDGIGDGCDATPEGVFNPGPPTFYLLLAVRPTGASAPDPL